MGVVIPSGVRSGPARHPRGPCGPDKFSVVIPSGVRSGPAWAPTVNGIDHASRNPFWSQVRSGDHAVTQWTLDAGRNPFWSQVRSGTILHMTTQKFVASVVIPSGVRSGPAPRHPRGPCGPDEFCRNPFWSQVRSGKSQENDHEQGPPVVIPSGVRSGPAPVRGSSDIFNLPAS